MLDLYFFTEKCHPQIFVHSTNIFLKIFPIDVLYLLYHLHDVFLVQMAYHQVINVPSDCHLNSIPHLLCNAGNVWIYLKSHLL
jgi:hypothetical protein